MIPKKYIRAYRPQTHFLIACGFFVSYLSGENDIETLHYYSGYAPEEYKTQKLFNVCKKI